VMAKYFGTNGIRGVLGEGFFTLGFIHDMAAAIGSHMGTSSPVLVGYDGRKNSSLICHVVVSALSYNGSDCTVVGCVPTPCLEYEVKRSECAGGIMITASHNPPAYNGIKVVAQDGVEISRRDELQIESAYEKRITTSEWSRPARWGIIRQLEGQPGYLHGIISQIDSDSIASKRFKVVLDPGNGVQGPFSSELCAGLNCQTIVINGEVDGDFPGRGPEPTPENLSGLSHAVVENGADMGIAFDGDGDRSIFCDETGRIITGDRSALILMRHILKSNRGATVSTSLNSSSVTEVVAGEFDSEVIRTRVGSVDVSQSMKDVGSIVGFEENGGFMYGKHNPVRDGCMTLALMLEALADSDMTLSEHAGSLPQSFTVKRKIGYTPDASSGIIQYLGRVFQVNDDRDGLKILLSESGDRWVLVRASGTEPILRVYAEAPTCEQADEIADMFCNMLDLAGRIVS